MKNFYLKSGLKLTLLITSVFLSQCKKDDTLTAINPKSRLANNLKANLSSSSNLHFLNSKSYYIENSLPSGFVKNGSKDYTKFIQDAIDEHENCVFPAFPMLINQKGLKIPSNRTLTFLKGSELLMKPSADDDYGMLEIRNASNVVLINPVLKGDRYNHIGSKGEWGMGIAIYGSRNVTVFNPIATEMWGDGIYIGESDDIISKNITIKNAVLKHNRRDGMTVTAVDGLFLDSPYAGFSDGTKPMAGIAFEPNESDDEIKNVVINDPVTESNRGTGMFVDFGNLMGGGKKYVNVIINNHTDYRSSIAAIGYSRIPDGSGSTIQGTLKFVNPKWSGNSKKVIQTMLYGENDVHLVIENPIILDEENQMLSKEETLKHMKHKFQINRAAWSSITFVPNWPSLSDQPESSTGDGESPLIYAINAGGDSYKASNGILYQKDNKYSGGNIYETSSAISNTLDDELYKSERYGNFSYSLPIEDGTYEVTFKFAEIYHSSANKRQFNVLVEGKEVISDWDIFKDAGSLKAFNISKTVQVTDGAMNINFTTNIDNAKVAAFHIMKK